MTLYRSTSVRCLTGLMIAVFLVGSTHAGQKHKARQRVPRQKQRAAFVQRQVRIGSKPTPIQSQFSRAKRRSPKQSQLPRQAASSRRQVLRPADASRPDATTAAPTTPPQAPAAVAARPAAPQPVETAPSTPTAVRQPPIRYGRSIITFHNRSGEPAVVRLVGPTRGEVEVPDGGQNTIHRVASGHYVIYVRYGTPGNYRYTEGDHFDVAGSATSYSQTSITLHTVPAGNYVLHPSSAAEFAAAAR